MLVFRPIPIWLMIHADSKRIACYSLESYKMNLMLPSYGRDTLSLGNSMGRRAGSVSSPSVKQQLACSSASAFRCHTVPATSNAFPLSCVAAVSRLIMKRSTFDSESSGAENFGCKTAVMLKDFSFMSTCLHTGSAVCQWHCSFFMSDHASFDSCCNSPHPLPP